MFIFLFLTVAFVIGTAIYLNRKKKNVSTNLKQDSKNDTKEKSKKSNNSKYNDITNLLFNVIICNICSNNK